MSDIQHRESSDPPGGRNDKGGPGRRRSLFRRILTWLLLGGFVLMVILVIAALPLLKRARGWWDEAIVIADQHAHFQVAHPGWSFPARIRTTSTRMDLPPKRLVVEAKARDYVESCPSPGPGQFCAKNGKVTPRTGDELEPIELGWLIGPDGEIREHLPIDQAPKLLLDAILAAEDREFYNHGGVNFSAVIRAAFANAQEGNYVQGGSTLTMQLVRNLIQHKEKTIDRKLREMVMAMALDKHLGKRQILQMYLDAPYLGQKGGLSVCGFLAASRFYFGKEARDLTLAEAATLAAILPAPAKFAPDRYPERAKERRDRVLATLASNFGYDVKEALAEPVVTVTPAPMPEHYPAYMSATRAFLESRLTPQVLYGSGLVVTAGLDIYLQEITDELFPDRTHYLQNLTGRKKEPPLQSAAVLMDTSNGLIRALYGGSDLTAISFNRATQARRQAGSSFKPLTYALAFSQLGPDGLPKYSGGSTVPNLPRVFKTPQGDWQPRNLGGEYTTTTTLAQGLSWSQNMAAASLLDELGGPEKLIPFAEKLGYNTTKFPREMGLALGQAEITPLEMAQFAGTVANGGHKLTGTPVIRAIDAAGVERLGPPQAGEAVLTPEAAALTRELMRLVIDYGTGGAARGAGIDSGYAGEALGKTGTTDHEKDLWFMGATPVWSAVVWLGYDTPAPLGASASDLAAPLWGWWMSRVTKFDAPFPKFPAEPKIVHRGICTITGLIPNETCRVVPAPFLPGTGPKAVCKEEHPPPEPPVDPEAQTEDGESILMGPLEPGAAGGTIPGIGGGVNLSPAAGGPGNAGNSAGNGAGNAAGGAAGNIAGNTASGAAGTATGPDGEPVKKKPRHYESIWKRMAREKAEKEAQDAGTSPAPD